MSKHTLKGSVAPFLNRIRARDHADAYTDLLASDGQTNPNYATDVSVAPQLNLDNGPVHHDSILQ